LRREPGSDGVGPNCRLTLGDAADGSVEGGGSADVSRGAVEGEAGDFERAAMQRTLKTKRSANRKIDQIDLRRTAARRKINLAVSRPRPQL
jgi:hypothetical protein